VHAMGAALTESSPARSSGLHMRNTSPISPSPQIETLLREVGLFSGVDERTLHLLANIAFRRSLAAGSVAVRQGDTDAALFAVTDGLLQASVQASDGREIVLSVMRKGDVFGELSLLDRKVRSATVTALRTTEVVVFPADKLVALMREEPELSLRMLVAVVDLVRRLTTRAEELSALAIPARLAKKLIELADLCGTSLGSGHTALPPTLSQQQLANHIQATRESVNKSLSAWMKEGILERSATQLVILNRARLATFAQGGGEEHGRTSPRAPDARAVSLERPGD